MDTRELFDALCVFSIFINLVLLFVSVRINIQELQALSILNIILLSFAFFFPSKNN